ncbi:rhomboid family intramembrane serine protease [Timonella sp. A28]|uniref:rhomboid family intramembrane serine protease n=1 Tax=Timonella sp. A28 TaxID=3442640 RepID=UPI003EBE126C
MSEPQFGSGAQPQNVPVCKNHPDRVTYVRCQRCGDPICPDCTHQAAVGVQCTQCVREGARNIRPQMTIAGGRVRTGRPVATLTFIGLCVVAYVAQMALGWDGFTSKYAFAPARAESEPWRFITGAFLHSPNQIFHILLNMAALWIVGSQLEFILGRWRFVTLYLLAAVGGNVMVLLLSAPLSVSWNTPTVGASGAIFGLFGALIPVARKIGAEIRSIYVLIGINVAISFIVPNVSWQGHFGGLIVGLLLSLAYVKAPKENRTKFAVGASVGVALILIAVTLLKLA